MNKLTCNHFIRLLLLLLLSPSFLLADGSWTPLNPFPGGARSGMFYFQIGSRCFAGGGTNGSTFYNDFYEYFPATDSWQPRAPHPMIGLAYGVGFTINGKGYAGIGQGSNASAGNAFFEYDPASNSWTQKTTFPGIERTLAIGVSYNGKGYVGTGDVFANNQLLGDMWEYDPGNNSWLQKSSMPGTAAISGAASFIINSKIILASNINILTNDVIEYDPQNDSWLIKNNFTCYNYFHHLKGIILNNEPYIIGHSNGCVILTTECASSGFYISEFVSKYNIASDSLTAIDDITYEFPSRALQDMILFTYNNRIIIATGDTGSANVNEVWSFDTEFDLSNITMPGIICHNNSFELEYEATGFNPGNIFSVQLSDSGGNFSAPTIVGSLSSTTSGTIPLSFPGNLPEGEHYRMRVVSSDPFYISYTSSCIALSSNNSGSITSSGPLAICKDDFVTLTSPEGTEYLWNTGAVSQSIDVSEPGTYTVTVDANTGCATALAPVTVTQLGNGTSKGIQWKKQFPGTGTSGRVNAIQQTQDGGYISGGYSWLAKVDASGVTQWETTALNGISISHLQQTQDGNYILAGSIGGVSDLCIAKANSVGQILWMVNYGTPGGYESANFIKECPDKGFIITGYNGGTFPSNATSDIWVLKTDSLGVLIWDQTYSGSLSEEGKSVDICLDGGYIISGQTNSSTGIGAGNHGGYDEVVLKLDATGNLTWVKVFGGSNSDFGNSVISLPDGGFILGGSTESTNGDLDDDGLHYGSYWLKKLDPLGEIVWSKRFGSGGCRLNAMVRNPDGHFILAGNVVTNPPVTSIAEAYGTFHYEDFWIVKTDVSGNIIWKKVIGGNNRDYCQSVTCTNDGWVAVAGFTNSNDGYFSNLVGNYDNWIFKLKNVAHISAFANNFEICGGNPLILTASPGNNYLWSTGATAQQISVTTSGTYSVTVDDCNPSDPVQVIISPISPYSICADVDNDGYGGQVNCQDFCGINIPGGFSDNNSDCNDTVPSINLDAIEVCNSIDDNCDGFVDENLDMDGDGICENNDNCPDTPNFDQTDTDMDLIGDACDNCINHFNPLQEDLDYDTIGDICDNCIDVDGDGYCNTQDCDDQNDLIYPGAQEICNTFDENCNMIVDENCKIGLVIGVYYEGAYSGLFAMLPVLDPLNAPFIFDSITVSLASIVSPYTIVATYTCAVNIFGTTETIWLPPGYQNQSYYLIVKHRNSIETWSKTPLLFSDLTYFDFRF